ncbi:tetratricopeptide repeat protein [Bacillus sp. SCS-153A]|uniref:tetratricopeptide repeat protein n=1 Tax=Rossellomorea sedimentorum TaxID=3115294 RepID=UPI0039063BED
MTTNKTLMEPWKFTPERIAFFRNFAFVEAVDSQQEYHYLFFYKEQFLTCKKALKLKRSSFIEQAFKEGIVFLCPHPLAAELMKQNAPLKMISFNDLHKKLRNTMTPQETAFIFRALDAFLSNEKLFHLIRNLYYEYRRNGQFLHAYKILWILTETFPAHSWVNQTSADLHFRPYEKLYTQSPISLLEKDPLYAASELWKHRHETDCNEALQQLLLQQKQTVTTTALMMESLMQNPCGENLQSLTLWIRTHFNADDEREILFQLAKDLPENIEILQLCLHASIETGEYEKALELLSHTPASLKSIDENIISGILEAVQWQNTDTPLEKLNTLIFSVLQEHPAKLEKILKSCVQSLLKGYDVPFIAKWMTPLKTQNLSLPTAVKIKKMLALMDDPENQSQLGEHYYQLDNIDRAIDCFSWEMELRPDDPQPVKWLSRLYQEKGMAHEAKAYQQVLVEMQKRA